MILPILDAISGNVILRIFLYRGGSIGRGIMQSVGEVSCNQWHFILIRLSGTLDNSSLCNHYAISDTLDKTPDCGTSDKTLIRLRGTYSSISGTLDKTPDSGTSEKTLIRLSGTYTTC